MKGISDQLKRLRKVPERSRRLSDPPITMFGGLSRIGAFFVLAGFLTFFVDRAISLSLRQVSTGEFGVWNRIVQGEINADILISGSSRALAHYNSHLLQSVAGRSAYNIGLNGSHTDMQLARLKTYLQYNSAPDILIHNLDSFSFQVTHEEVYDPGQYIPYISEPDLYEALAQIDPGVWKWRYVPLYGYATQDLRLTWPLGILRWLLGKTNDTHIQGFWPKYRKWTGDFERYRNHHPDGVHIDVEPEGVQQLEELLRVCTNLGIKVVLSYSPEYKEAQSMTLNRGDIFARFEALSQQYGALMLDFSDSAISSRKNLFYNSQHLNADGASAFTRELFSRLDTVEKNFAARLDISQ